MQNVQQIKMGDRLKRISINRADVAQNTIGRAVLLDENPMACYLAYDQDVKRMVFANQDIAVKYKLNPRATYILLIARLETDMRGNVLGDNFTIEYLQLSDKVYDTFLDSFMELDSCRTLKLKKEATSPTFSYVKPIPSKDDLPDDVKAKLDKFLSSADLQAMWSIALSNVAIEPEAYEKLKLGEGNARPSAPQQSLQSPKPAPQISAPKPQPDSASSFEADPEDFGDAGEFDEFK